MQLITIGTEPIAPLAYDLVSEHHRPTMRTIGGHGGWLKRERYTKKCDRSTQVGVEPVGKCLPPKVEVA